MPRWGTSTDASAVMAVHWLLPSEICSNHSPVAFVFKAWTHFTRCAVNVQQEDTMMDDRTSKQPKLFSVDAQNVNDGKILRQKIKF